VGKGPSVAASVPRRLKSLSRISRYPLSRRNIYIYIYIITAAVCRFFPLPSVPPLLLSSLLFRISHTSTVILRPARRSIRNLQFNYNVSLKLCYHTVRADSPGNVLLVYNIILYNIIYIQRFLPLNTVLNKCRGGYKSKARLPGVVQLLINVVGPFWREKSLSEVCGSHFYFVPRFS